MLIYQPHNLQSISLFHTGMHRLYKSSQMSCCSEPAHFVSYLVSEQVHALIHTVYTENKLVVKTEKLIHYQHRKTFSTYSRNAVWVFKNNNSTLFLWKHFTKRPWSKWLQRVVNPTNLWMVLRHDRIECQGHLQNLHTPLARWRGLDWTCCTQN